MNETRYAQEKLRFRTKHSRGSTDKLCGARWFRYLSVTATAGASERRHGAGHRGLRPGPAGVRAEERESTMDTHPVVCWARRTALRRETPRRYRCRVHHLPGLTAAGTSRRPPYRERGVQEGGERVGDGRANRCRIVVSVGNAGVT